MSKNTTIGQLLNKNNADYLMELHQDLLGHQVFVREGKGYLGYVEEILDNEYVIVRDIRNNESKVSIFNLRTVDYAPAYIQKESY